MARTIVGELKRLLNDLLSATGAERQELAERYAHVLRTEQAAQVAKASLEDAQHRVRALEVAVGHMRAAQSQAPEASESTENSTGNGETAS